MKRFVLRLVACFALLGAPVAHAVEPSPLSGVVYGSGVEALVVVLHGDVSKGGAADYHYSFAERVAQSDPGVTVAALLRPGYYDGAGRTSTGSNNDRRDHYTTTNNDLVVETIRGLKAATGAPKVIGVAHSGGAAQLGVIMGRYPGLVDMAILVSCPCDVPAWRSANGRSAWKRSESPQDFVAKISPTARVVAITGSKDKNTAPAWGIAYVRAAQKAGATAEFVEVPGAGHGFDAMTDRVMATIAAERAR